MLGEELDKQVGMYIGILGSKGCPINTAILMATALGIVRIHDSNLPSCNGGHIDINKHWGKNFLARLGYAKRRLTPSRKSMPTTFDFWRNNFCLTSKQ